MKAIIRTHVRNPQRLELLKNTIRSARRVGIHRVMVIDDQSPLMVDVRVLCAEEKCEYLLTKGTPGTKNGLYWSLRMDEGSDLHLCDDAELSPTDWQAVPASPDWWLLSYFACYNRDTNRTWWWYPVSTFYAALACRFHPDLRAAYIKARDEVSEGRAPETAFQDDILVKLIIAENGKEIWNTGWDYAQHTGIGILTTMGPGHNSDYRSQFFIGERNQA